MNDYQQDLFRYVAEEFAEDYREGEMERREFLRRSVLLGGSVVGARTLLATLGITGVSAAELAAAQTAAPQNEPAKSRYQIAPDDPEIEAGAVTYEALGRTNLAYLARPKGGGAAPVVLVIHENRGLQPHIEDVARRVAKAGFIALAPDFVSSEGGTKKFTDTALISSFIARTPAETHAAHGLEAVRFLRSQPGAQAERLGMVGFCWGGGMTWLLSTKLPDLKAAIPFYGPSPSFAEIPKIRAAVLGIYGGKDARITGNAAATEKALTDAGVKHEFLIYPGAAHAFHNDTGANYKQDAAENAWASTLVWLRGNL
ncbi:dienelactone hydrolase family protein [Deinococcus koreensis]|uniref:Dienelactone hydrolase family protein n=1 Tax=Deinococcus koreensis TaxID=2054903 RepID=A0A2K3V027_9DEIO|nr:dienelactone hydrolase family protein [Deinococcus koreensis]PNY82139.1 dienelactone hydrolase family protein [Deinococcus koreensis]